MTSEIHWALSTNQSVDHLVIAPITTNTQQEAGGHGQADQQGADAIEARSVPPGRRFSMPRKYRR